MARRVLASPDVAALQAINGDNKVGPLEHLNQPVKECARYCAGGVLDILQGCAEPRLRPEALIADQS